MRLESIATIILCLLVAACTPATPMGITWPGKVSETEKTIRGVVNGFWQYDPVRNSARLRGSFGKANDAQVSALASRYLVRVGINRSYFIGTYMELVVLPKDWTYSLTKVVDDGHTINIGDVVDMRTVIGANFAEVISIVRKCDALAVADENKDWSIGCKQIEGFDSQGYGGEKYYLSGF